MPFVTCSGCGLSTYCVSEADCPHCDARLSARAGPPAGPEPRGARDPASALLVRRALTLARDGMRADVACLSEITRGQEIIQTMSGDPSMGLHRGAVFALEDTICERMLEGSIGRLVPDVHAEPALADLELEHIGAYAGVPMTAADARVYILCCLAREARPDLGEADLRFLEGVAASLRSVLDGG